MTEGLRVSGGVSGGLIVFSAGELERRVFDAKRRVAELAWQSRDSCVARAAGRLLERLTELLEDLGEGVSPLEVLPRFSMLVDEVDSFMADPEGYARELCSP